MKKIILALPVLFLATALHAEGVLVPSAGTSPDPRNQLPQKESLPTIIPPPKPTIVEQKKPLSDLQKTIVGGQSKPEAGIIYMQPAQQQQLINAETQNLEIAKQGLSQLRQMMAEDAATARTPEEKEAVRQSEASNLEMIAQMNEQYQKSQARLNLLKSGPLRYSDLSKVF